MKSAGDIRRLLRQNGPVSAPGSQPLTRPLRSRASWVASGLLLQVTGAGGAAAYGWLTVRHQGIGGHLTAATVQLAWHSELHTRLGLAVLAAGALLYATGSVFLARPYVTRPVTLFVAVPVAAIAGMLVLGALAIILALLAVWADNDLNLPDPGFWPGRSKRKRPRQR